MIKYIILNGPPASGKTTIARELTRELTLRGFTVAQDSFAAPMKHFIATALGEQYQHMDKERMRPELSGYSARQFLIDLSQNYIKERYGMDAFARWLVHRSLRTPFRKPDYVVCDDGGFDYEIEAVPNKYVVQVHREGKTFAGDSRSYYNPQHVSFYVFENNGNFADMLVGVKVLVESIP